MGSQTERLVLAWGIWCQQGLQPTLHASVCWVRQKEGDRPNAALYSDVLMPAQACLKQQQ